MTDKDFADIIRLVRRAPLNNMDEAEYVANLLQRYAAFVCGLSDVQSTGVDEQVKERQSQLPL